MMDSMTPPVSPVHAQDVEMIDDFDSFPLHLLRDLEPEAQVPQQTRAAVCFQCEGEVFLRRGAHLYQHISFHDRGMLKSCALQGMLGPDSVVHPEPTVELFGFTFPFIALRDRMDKLFSFARQTMGEIQNSADQDQGSRLRRRQYIVDFLQYVDAFVKSSLPEDENERRRFLRSLLRHLQLLLVHSGRISEDGSPVRYSLNQLENVHHSFHYRLDLNWALLTVLHTLTTASCAPELPLDVKWCQQTSGDEEVRSVFDQMVTLTLYDLVSLAVPVFAKLSAHEWLLTSPFPCVCVLELWVLLIHLLRHRKDKFHSESFWVQLHQILQTLHSEPEQGLDQDEDIDTDVFVLGVCPAPNRPLGFCLWLTTHLAHLFCFDPHGNIAPPDPTQSCFFAIQMTMEKMMRTSLKEETLRACLRCCLSVSSVWSPSGQLVTLLWEHFAKKLNDRFQLHTTSIEGLAAVTKSSSALLERCRKWCDASDTGLEQESSFHLYLRLVARLLSDSAGPLEWRQIKGRFFSKFHQRRMQELQEMGLHNMSCLFITIALCVDAEELAKKLLALYEMVNPSSLYGRLRGQVWCGVLAIAQLLARLHISMDVLAQKMAASFTSVAKQLSSSLLDYGQKQELSSLVILYMDGVRDVVELSSLEGAEHLYIGAGVVQALRTCSDSEMRHTLTALDSVVMRLRSLVCRRNQDQSLVKDSPAPGQVAFADSLWVHIYPFVCEHSTTLTPPLSLADLAVSFAYLALDLPALPATCSEGVVGVVRQFTTSDTVHASIACHFLNQLLSDPALKNSAVSASSSSSSTSSSSSSSSSLSGQRAMSPLTQSEVVRCWWRCLLLMSPSSSSISELTQHVMLLPEVQSLLSPCQQEQGTPNVTSGPHTWKQFLKAIGSRFASTQNLLEKQRLREAVVPYFRDTVQQVMSVVRSWGPQDTLINVYRVVGTLVKHCAPLLYMQSKPCPLPEVIRVLVLPSCVLHQDRTLHPNMLAALRDSLHLFLEGLGRLDGQRDPYVQRQARSIVTQFMQRFPLNVLDIYSHPVLRLLGRLPHQTTFTDDDFHRFVADVAVESLKKINTAAATEVMTTLKTRYRPVKS